MSVTAVSKDPENLSMSITSEFDATPERVWQLWADPRQLERWWGPPTYPATVTDHDLSQGGRVAYFMTGPEGDRHHGYWEVTEVDPPRALAYQDGFATTDGTPDTTLPRTLGHVAIEAIGAHRTRMTITSHFADLQAMEKLLEMGMDEGMTLALGQIDAILDEGEEVRA